MALYAQHGHGKGDKIGRSLQQGSISGVVLSPRNEQPDRLRDFVDRLRRESTEQVTILFDPQFYATTIPDARDGCLPDYPYYRPGLTRRNFIASTDLREYASGALRYQAALPLDRLISAAVLFDDFRDPWSQVWLAMAQESIVSHDDLAGASPLLLSLPIDESALRNRDRLDEFLDIVTTWNPQGFYILVRRADRDYPAVFDESVLANLLYLVYVLGSVNNFEIVCGYTDMVGLSLMAVGATAIASGWYNTLRQFSLSRFQPATGGRAPRRRYTSAPLMNSILVVPELSTIGGLGRIEAVLSNSEFDAVMRTGNPANAAWPPDIACLHHWQVLSRLASEVAVGQIRVRLDRLEEMIEEARAVYGALQNLGAQFEYATGSRDLQIMSRAVRTFRGELSL